MTDPGGDETGERNDPFTVPIGDVQPSQPLLNGRKLSLAAQWFDFDDPEYDPIPVVEYEGALIPTDGHTRAFVAYLAGSDELVVRHDDDDLPMALYGRCVEYTREAGVTSVGDLAGRVVNAAAFEEQWVARCEAAAEDLD
ncbi:histone acetyltransferase [Halobacteriaceae archaeon GCM10025711]